MADTTDLPITPANDGFETHYAEKIWALVPEVYRNADGLAERSGRLRALVEILAGQAAVARRSVDRLWADTRADEADDWAIPYIGALIGARPVNALNRAAQRANLGRTILYRRRQGTVRLTELLADDIADWDAIASEGFLRVIRHWHLLDGGPEPGRITRSPKWGYADLRNVRIGDILDTGHDDLSHFPDFRRHRGLSGRYGIPKVNLHLYRHYAYQLSGVIPRLIAPEHYTLDPSGRDVALYQPGGQDAANACAQAREWEMRAPIPCRRLTAASFLPKIAHAPVGLEALLEPIYGRRFATEQGLLKAATAALEADPTPPNALADSQAAELIAAAMEGGTPRRNLLPDGDKDTCAITLAIAANANDDPLGPQKLYGADLTEWAVDHGVPGWVEALVDPETGRVRLMDALPGDRDLLVQKIHYGTFWPVGAGTHDRASGLSDGGFTLLDADAPDLSTVPLSGEFRFADSRTFTPVLPANGIVTADGDLTLAAANRERPFIEAAPPGGTLTLRAVAPGLTLTIDGIWFSLLGAAATRLSIDGTWAKVILRNVTLDPGGERAAVPPALPEAIPPVTLTFGGAIDDIVLDRCVTGPITETITAIDPCAVDAITICDSVVHGTAPDPAIFLRNARACLDRSTVLGDLVTGALDASEVIVDGQVRVENAQSGCFRFSAAASGGRVPQAYESHFFTGVLPPTTFISKRFGDAAYAQLSEVAPDNIRRGGEDGTEMGAYHAALDPIKRADLRDKLEEFMPINAIAQLVYET